MGNISRSKGNQAMKFSQLIAYNVRNIFLYIMQKMTERLAPVTSIFI